MLLRPPRVALFGLLLLIGVGLAAMTIRASAAGGEQRGKGLPPVPRGWPRGLELGLADPPGGAAALAGSAGFAIRYQYLSGGVNTGVGWRQWAPDATFVDTYVEESISAGLLPVFSYYMLLQSAPGNALPEESEKDLVNLATRSTMRSYFEDLEAFFSHAARFAPQPVVLHVEPDLWGYAQQAARNDDASTVGAQVAATGLPRLKGLPNDVSGLARAVVRLRNKLAPNVVLGYHLSVWGTGKDPLHEKPPNAVIDELATRSARFYHSLHADFDLTFAEYGNRNAAYGELVLGDKGVSRWGAEDYARQVRYLGEFVRLSRRRAVLWQIPVGNTRMRAMNNTRFHYQDRHVQWLLGRDGRRHLRGYRRAGLIGLLFGPALPGDTCACDAAGDGVTNPAPINGNRKRSYSADDDGGFLRRRARLYERRGPLRLPR